MTGTNHRWPCGHPRTAENTRSVGKAGLRCRECRRVIDKRYIDKAHKLVGECEP